MGTLKDYFISDNKHKIKTTNQNFLNLESGNGDKIIIDVQLYFDFASGAKYYSYYIPFVLPCLLPFVYSVMVVSLIDNEYHSHT